MTHSRPAGFNDRSILRHAVDAAIWGMPAVNYELMYTEMADKLGGGYNQILYWSRLLDWKSQTLTPNPDVIYLMPFFNTMDEGPMVLEIPPADDGVHGVHGVFNGSVMNCWQAAIEDIGPGGLDRGDGGRYVILPPGHDAGDIPSGHIAMPCDTYQGYALVRSVLKSGSDTDIAHAVAYGRRLRLYPLSAAANPPSTVFIDASDAIFDSTILYDAQFFSSLNRIVQAEPWLERDRAMIDTLKAIGIERGEPFEPDERTKRLFDEAMLQAKAIFDERWESAQAFYDGGSWLFPVSPELQHSIGNGFTTSDSYPVGERGWLYSFIFFSARHLGRAQFYLMATRDAAGQPLHGGATYRVHVPANAPVTQYWSLSVYNRATHTFIRDAPRVGRSSQTPGLRVNDDGAVDIFFGPSAPATASNWIPTDPNGGFEVLARFYGPQSALFDKTWRLGDIEKVAGG